MVEYKRTHVLPKNRIGVHLRTVEDMKTRYYYDLISESFNEGYECVVIVTDGFNNPNR